MDLSFNRKDDKERERLRLRLIFIQSSRGVRSLNLRGEDKLQYYIEMQDMYWQYIIRLGRFS